jgi:hypothetical protein
MRTYHLLFIIMLSTSVLAQNPEPTPTPKMYLGHQVDTSPYRDDELEAIRKIEAHKKKVMLLRQKLIQEGKATPNKWDLKFVEDMKAKGEEIVVPDSINSEVSEGSSKPIEDADEEFKKLVEKRQRRNEKLNQQAKAENDSAPEAVVTPAPEATKELSEEEKKYNKEKEEFLKKFKQKQN